MLQVEASTVSLLAYLSETHMDVKAAPKAQPEEESHAEPFPSPILYCGDANLDRKKSGRDPRQHGSL